MCPRVGRSAGCRLGGGWGRRPGLMGGGEGGLDGLSLQSGHRPSPAAACATATAAGAPGRPVRVPRPTPAAKCRYRYRCLTPVSSVACAQPPPLPQGSPLCCNKRCRRNACMLPTHAQAATQASNNLHQQVGTPLHLQCPPTSVSSAGSMTAALYQKQRKQNTFETYAPHARSHWWCAHAHTHQHINCRSPLTLPLC